MSQNTSSMQGYQQQHAYDSQQEPTGLESETGTMQQQNQQHGASSGPQNNGMPPGFENSGLSPSMLNSGNFAALVGGSGMGNMNNNNSADGITNQGGGGGGMDVNSELKRLQQLQQQMNPQGQSNNALLGQNSNMGNPQMSQMNQAAGFQNNQALLQQMLDQQKMQSNSGNYAMGATGAPGNINPLFGQPGLLNDARLLLAQTQFGGIGGGMPGQNNMGDVPLPSPHSLFHRDGTRRMRGGVIEPFPEKLHRLLIEVEAAGRSDVISFVANGRAFAIHKPDKFFKEIVPLYFRQSRLSSFKRQLNLYGFELINTGPSRGGYFHELFVKDRAELCRRMRRVAVKVSGKDDATKDKGTAAAAQQNNNDAGVAGHDDNAAAAAAQGEIPDPNAHMP